MTTSEDQPDTTKGGGMPFLEHVEELRRRILKSLLAVVVMSGAAFYFSDELIKLIKIPIGDTPLHNIQVTGTFYAYLKISLITGVVAALPVVFYQMWAFISPGLLRREKIVILPLVLISTVLFVIGGGFCFVVVLPIALRFLIGFGGELVINYITIGSYISFAGLLLLAFGFAFQLPIVSYILGRIGLISSRGLAKGRRYAAVLILVVAAIITPPDVFTQVLLAVPIYLLYEISIVVVYLTGRRT
ncbi:MAG TPA: twin-arginine translocase subunit TatC [Acidobacteriota bacterium]|nr:twin-arginine translocase subunit TatC [Acidobacteriota bacterium]